MRHTYHVATAILLVLLAACSSVTAPEPSIACVLVAQPAMPSGWSAAVWMSPVRGAACKIPSTGVNTIPR